MMLYGPQLKSVQKYCYRICMSFRGYPIFARIIDDFASTFVQMKGPTASSCVRK